MSCWCELDFSVTGPEPITRELKRILPDQKFDDGARLFHHVEIISSLPGFVVVHASRNYHGGAAICELIARFPDLSFQGSLHSDVGYDHYTLFYGQSGETTFQDFVIPDFEMLRTHCTSRAEVEEQILGLTGKIDGLEFERAELKEYLTRLNSGEDPPS